MSPSLVSTLEGDFLNITTRKKPFRISGFRQHAQKQQINQNNHLKQALPTTAETR